MPPEDVEIVRRGVDALNETYRTGDMVSWRRHVERAFDPEIVLETPDDAFIEGDWRGHDGVVGFVANQMEALEEMWLRVDEIDEVAPGKLALQVAFGGRARHSGLEVELRPTHVFTVRDGRAVRWQILRGRIDPP